MSAADLTTGDPATAAPPTGHLLEARGISVEYKLKDGRHLRAVHQVSFDVAVSSTLAVIGESGSGKSTVGKAVLRLLPLAEGEIRFDGVSLTALKGKRLADFRRRIQVVFQDPHSALDPRMTAWQSIQEPLRAQGIRGSEADDRAALFVKRVGLNRQMVSRYPHQLSGGQKQRINIARALVSDPSLIVCDEPVSALDVSLQAEIVNLLRELQDEFGLAYLFITHDITLLPHLADDVAVQYLGVLAELGPARDVLTAPLHPYTRGLLDSVPSLSRRRGDDRRERIRGEIPDPMFPPSGCRFRTRCPFATERCEREVPELREIRPRRFAACHFSEQLADTLAGIATPTVSGSSPWQQHDVAT